LTIDRLRKESTQQDTRQPAEQPKPFIKYKDEGFLKDAVDNIIYSGKSFIHGSQQGFDMMKLGIWLNRNIPRYWFADDRTSKLLQNFNVQLDINDGQETVRQKLLDAGYRPRTKEELRKSMPEGFLQTEDDEQVFAKFFGEIPETIDDWQPGGTWVTAPGYEKAEQTNQTLLDYFLPRIQQRKADYNNWLQEHPELSPNPEYVNGWLNNPELLTDPDYLVYELTSSITYMLAALSSAAITTAVTGSGVAGLLAGAAAVSPALVDEVYQSLILQGATEEQAIQIAAVLGPIEGGIESLTNIPILSAAKGTLFKPVTNRILKGLAGRVLRSIPAKATGATLIGAISEGIDETSQQFVTNLARKAIDENASLIEGLAEAASRAAIPGAIFGGAAGTFGAIRTQDAGEIQQVSLVDELPPPNVSPEIEVVTTPEEATTEEIAAEEPFSLEKIAAERGVKLTQVSSEDANKSLLYKTLVDLKENGAVYIPAQEGKPAEIIYTEEATPSVFHEIGHDIYESMIGKTVDDPIVKLVDDVFLPEYKKLTDRLPPYVLRVKNKAYSDLTKKEKAAVLFTFGEDYVADLKPDDIITLHPFDENEVFSNVYAKLMKGQEAKNFKETSKAMREMFNIPESGKAFTKKTLGKAKTEVRAKIKRTGTERGFYTKRGKKARFFNRYLKKYDSHSDLRRMTLNELKEILEYVESGRPEKIGNKIVITDKTERNIQAHKGSLVRAELLTDAGYQRIMDTLGLEIDHYENPESFITESEGFNLMKTMDNQAAIGLTEMDAKVSVGLEKSKNVAEAHNKIISKLERRKIETGKVPTPSRLWDIARYMQELQNRTGDRFYEVYYMMINRKLLMDELVEKMHSELEAIAPEQELAIAEQIKMEYKAAEHRVRFNRIHWGIDMYNDDAQSILDNVFKAGKAAEEERQYMPTLAEIQEAIDAWASGGDQALWDYTADKEWGVIHTGYDPRMMINPQFELSEIRWANTNKTHLHGRTIEDMPEMEENILQRRKRYWRRLFALDLEPYAKELERLFKENYERFEDPRKVEKDISQFIKEVYGFIPRSEVAKLMLKSGSWAFSVLSLSPHMFVRNLHQNIAFHPDAMEAFSFNNRELSEAEKQYSDISIKQYNAIKRDWLMQEALGNNKLARFIKKISYYAKSDWINRRVSMWISVNKAERAMKRFEASGDIDEFMEKSGFYDLQPLEQKHILDLVVLKEVDFGGGIPKFTGHEAAVLELARLITEKTHFRYRRFERAPIEMGESGRLAGSLMTFPRGFGQKLYDHINKLRPGSDATTAEKQRAGKDLITMVAGMLIANSLYMLLTGKERGPYDPREILGWQPGGLAIGYGIEVANAISDLVRAATGDAKALDRAATSIQRMAEMTVPFYKQAIDILEAALGTRYADRQGIRKIKELVNKEYKMGKEYYNVERNAIQVIQHALFGTRYAEQVLEGTKDTKNGTPKTIQRGSAIDRLRKKSGGK